VRIVNPNKSGRGACPRISNYFVSALKLEARGELNLALAADSLQRMGYTNVFSLAGGWRAWQDAGGEIETS
jgi:hypothetical protein